MGDFFDDIYTGIECIFPCLHWYISIYIYLHYMWVCWISWKIVGILIYM